MNQRVRTYAFQGPLDTKNTEQRLLNIEEVFDPSLYIGYWPCNLPELIEILQNLVARVKSRASPFTHPFLTVAREHFELIFRGFGGFGVPRSIAGDYLLLMHNYNMCPDGLISDERLILLVENINALAYNYMNAKMSNNAYGLKTTLENISKQKEQHAASN